MRGYGGACRVCSNAQSLVREGRRSVAGAQETTRFAALALRACAVGDCVCHEAAFDVRPECCVRVALGPYHVRHRTRTPRSQCSRLGFTCVKQCGKEVCTDVFTLKCTCTTMISDGFQPQTCTGAWCVMRWRTRCG